MTHRLERYNHLLPLKLKKSINFALGLSYINLRNFLWFLKWFLLIIHILAFLMWSKVLNHLSLKANYTRNVKCLVCIQISSASTFYFIAVVSLQHLLNKDFPFKCILYWMHKYGIFFVQHTQNVFGHACNNTFL